MKTLLFSGIFPKSHPRAGEPTNFVKAIRDGKKIHTIRANAKKHFKDGDLVSMRYWSGKPYASKQVEFAQCKLRLESITMTNNYGFIFDYIVNARALGDDRVVALANNDGLGVDDFISWFFPDASDPFSLRVFTGDILHFVDIEFKDGE